MSGIGCISYKAATYLVAILNPLTGKNGFTIKNSKDFVNKVKDLEVPSRIGCISYKEAKYLAEILNPLTGKNGFTIKNSQDFVNKVKDLEVPPPRKMLSYDVSALFTSTPVDEAIHVIRGRLEKDTSLPERCELSSQIIILLEFSLDHHLLCDSVFYH